MTGMRKIFSSSNSVQVGAMKNRLELAGIPCEIRNEAVSQAIVGMPFEPELWVLNDEDYEEAREIIAAE